MKIYGNLCSMQASLHDTEHSVKFYVKKVSYLLVVLSYYNVGGLRWVMPLW